MFSSCASVFTMTGKDQHQSTAMEAWQKTLPAACQNNTCGHDTVDHPGHDQCGGKMYCVTCRRWLQNPGCYFCRMNAMSIKTEDCEKLVDEIIKLWKDNLMFNLCPQHDQKTSL